jgi:hypothetical protein
LVGDELLPPTAPKGKRDVHISVLDGGRPDSPGAAPNVCFVVLDPDFAHVAPSKARTWVLERLETEPWSEDKSILVGDRLRRWIDEFATRDLDPMVLEKRFYRDLILIQVDRENVNSIILPAMELSYKLNVPFISL